MDSERSDRLLGAYPWSSHHPYAGRGQSLPLVDETVVRQWFPTVDSYNSYLMLPRIYGQEELTFTRL